MFSTIISKHKQRAVTTRPSHQRGFSLPELIIVIGIFVIITTIALFNQGRLSSSVLLTNMAYEVGLAIREAQIYGIGVRSEDTGDNFTGQYGVHFTTANPRQVIVYADNAAGPDDTQYTYTAGEEKYIYEFNNSRGNKILAMCAGDWGGGPCNDAVGDQTMDILFKRPNPAAIVKRPGEDDPTSARVYIVVTNLDEDDCRAVIVEPTGQIRVEDSSKGACSVNPQP